ncbi:metal ABC transporter ATP-binding protein [Cohnella thailandensis]|uniref:Metal ABC transporter ATP-binding protein n=1 Tax=Cohnella thailandensis TaxID=557557 RepID=A0A841SUH3_9BACL|nr:metal ABC transporter ATP-binding protein [Cohnella thailandensis]MBB6635554.1 metal ABC transporter ATP-binding protein [Cohnella thailandensis]MBP1974934.1 zinc transport system ATP-binding protein [Cohnella thailandensis]
MISTAPTATDAPIETGVLASSSCHREIVSLEDVSYSYGAQQVLDKVSFVVRERDFIGLIGSNGAGKTTLLRMIVGLLKPTSGEIKLFGTPMSKFKDWQLIGYVPQRNHFNPLFPATVREVVLSGLYGRRKLLKRITKEDHLRAEDALNTLKIRELAEKRIGELSGGQQQRVFLARALINNPKLLILDEPMSGIDTETQNNFFNLLLHMHKKHNITFLMVSHDMEMVRSYLGEIPRAKSGKLSFHVRHSHDLEDCGETDLLHSLRKEG